VCVCVCVCVCHEASNERESGSSRDRSGGYRNAEREPFCKNQSDERASEQNGNKRADARFSEGEHVWEGVSAGA
jgi:hypothetical protein